MISEFTSRLHTDKFYFVGRGTMATESYKNSANNIVSYEFLRIRKMCHGNPQGDKKLRKWGGKFTFLFQGKIIKRIKPPKCSKTYLQTSLIPQFSQFSYKHL